MTTDRRKRSHPAEASRIVVAGAGVTAFLWMVAGFIRSQLPPETAPEPPQAATVESGAGSTGSMAASTVQPATPTRTVTIQTVTVTPAARSHASR